MHSLVWHTTTEGAWDDGVFLCFMTGGAFKFAELFKTRLQAVTEKLDEMQCLTMGVSWLLQNVEGEAWYLEDPDRPLESDRLPAAADRLGRAVDRGESDRRHPQEGGWRWPEGHLPLRYSRPGQSTR